MIEVAYEWLRSQYGSNDFLVGTTIPFILAAVGYALKGFAFGVYRYIVRNFTVSVRINSTMEHFGIINEYVYNKYVWGIFRRNFVMAYIYKQSRLAMTSGYGNSIALVNGKPGIVSLRSEESDSWEFKEILEIKVMTFRPNVTARALFKEFETYVKEANTGDYVDVYRSSYDERILVTRKPKRAMSTIFVPEKMKAQILDSLNKFRNSEQAYAEKGIPWHFGLLLYGLPGTGKTSLIHAIASELGRDIHYHSSGSLPRMALDASKTILVLEDFDPVKLESSVTSKGQGKQIDSASTLADTLNFLDGFLTPEGLIVIATTNNIGNIASEILRPGRFDIVVEVPIMEHKEYLDMCVFYGVTPDPDFVPSPGAQLMIKIKQQWHSEPRSQEIFDIRD